MGVCINKGARVLASTGRMGPARGLRWRPCTRWARACVVLVVLSTSSTVEHGGGGQHGVGLDPQVAAHGAYSGLPAGQPHPSPSPSQRCLAAARTAYDDIAVGDETIRAAHRQRYEAALAARCVARTHSHVGTCLGGLRPADLARHGSLVVSLTRVSEAVTWE